jgi:lipopolysaccharide transport system ATP-binding protein
MDGVRACRIGENRYSMEISFTDLPLLPGAYLVRSHAMDSEAMRLFGTIERGLTVRGESREFGFVRLPHTWTGTAK